MNGRLHLVQLDDCGAFSLAKLVTAAWGLFRHNLLHPFSFSSFPTTACQNSYYFRDSDFHLGLWVESNLIRVMLPTPSHALIRLLVA